MLAMLTLRKVSSRSQRAVELLRKVADDRVDTIAKALVKLVSADALAHSGKQPNLPDAQTSPLVLLALAKLMGKSDSDRLVALLSDKKIKSCLRNAFDRSAGPLLARSSRSHEVRSRGPEPKRAVGTTMALADLEVHLAMLAALDSAIEAGELETRVNFKLLSLCLALSLLQFKARDTNAHTSCA